MFYDFAITVPAGTPENNPKEEELKLTHGIIHRIEISFAPGCHRYVFVRLFHQEHQIIPTNPDQAIAWDAYTVVIDEHLPLLTEPYLLKVKAYSPDAIYEHTIIVRVGILPPELLQPFAGMRGMFQKFFKLIGVGK